MTSSISAPDPRPRAASAVVDDDRLRVVLEDGRELSVPVSWFMWLQGASPEDRRGLSLIEYGLGIWWEALDEGISVPWLLGVLHH